ncbi:MAG TPA: preprotein translocase subunit YajC [Bacteroidales bacterium]|nr:MAG: preprotein translocase subunit YajC [Bacteroidetes bacterium ADurb.Bin217]HOS83877.1 preprotein translocase subunit YajC [Bacteroidales bacterium]HPM13190.1 preprotein translocase subunit YajC [Bacteroidales bacterium]
MNVGSIVLEAAAGQNPMGNLFLLVGIMVIFFFFMVRPQMKRQKEQKKFREGLQKGDSVVTLGGIYAKVVELKENNIVIIEIAKDVQVKIDKSALVADSTALQMEKK